MLGIPIRPDPVPVGRLRYFSGPATVDRIEIGAKGSEVGSADFGFVTEGIDGGLLAGMSSGSGGFGTGSAEIDECLLGIMSSGSGGFGVGIGVGVAVVVSLLVMLL